MSNKELLKNLSSLTLHAILVAGFGLILMSITAVTDFAASKIGHLDHPSVKVVTLALEVPFLLGVLAHVVTESRELVKALEPATAPALEFVRHVARRNPTGRRLDKKPVADPDHSAH